ncbi:MAG: hypothetical protein KDA93_12655 [Planctomycetaceae bacterium]|nr:hypothetical protein [Planctomycetaceae bacterium]
MSRPIQRQNMDIAGNRLAIERLRCEVAMLRRDIDLYGRLYSSWQSTRRQRDANAEVRFHLIEAQLARLPAVSTMKGPSIRPPTASRAARAVVIPISAYRA